MTRLTPYISFKGNAKEAIEFYKSVFGGNLILTTYKDGGMPHDPGEDEKVMHSMLETPKGLVLMAADTPSGQKQASESNISITLSGENDSEAELTEYFEKLSAGGTIVEPLRTAPWGDKFGMFDDKFGVHWMVNIAGKKA